jgi:hypothetical protein
MNKRIRELAEQCYHRYSEHHIDLEKFAELIVKECAMLVEGFILEQEVALDDYQEYEASAVLKEHFGVES